MTDEEFDALRTKIARAPSQYSPVVRQLADRVIDEANAGDQAVLGTSPALKLALAMWERFLDGCVIDGADLQDALIASGFARAHPADEEEAERYDVDEGDPVLVLTDEGNACVRRAKEAA